MRGLPSPSHLVLAGTAVVTVILLVLAIRADAALPSESQLAAANPPPVRPSVAFVGDGYTSGSPAGGRGPANYTALLGVREGWRVTDTAVYGSGYVSGAPLSTQVPKAADARPQLVVVSGGRADSGADPAAVRDAAAGLYQDLRTRLPRATVVVIGPMWTGGEAPRRIRAIRDAVRDSATAANLSFVDPIEERWFADPDPAEVTPDDDLTDRGHRKLADLVDHSLQNVTTLPR